MSKAFTSGDDAPQSPLGVLPSGRRPITQGGLARLRQELKEQLNAIRPSLLAAAAAGDTEAKSQLRKTDWHIEVLTRTIALSDPIPAGVEAPTRVGIGTKVRVRGADGIEASYSIVGPDEIDAARGLVSHASPLGRVLMGLEAGEWATIKRPAGEREVQVLAIDPA